jgi:alpha-N-acetylglucosamine transferase
MKQWDKLLYIDADVLVLKNLDHLFQYPNGSMLKYEVYAGEDENDTGFSGLFIIEPA